MNDTFDLVPCVPWLLLAQDFSLATHVQITELLVSPSLHHAQRFTLRGYLAKPVGSNGACSADVFCTFV